MAKPGKRISARSRAAIRLKYEAGLMSLSEIAKHHRIAKKTVVALAKEEGWQRGKVTAKVTAKVTERAVKKLIEKEGDRLYDYSSEYIDNITNLDKAHKANLNSYVRVLKESNGNISKAEADKFKSVQQFLKLSAETFKINFEGVRLAMGLDKEQGAAPSLTVNNIQDISALSDDELQALIYNAE